MTAGYPAQVFSVARETHDREDLLREATGLSPRIELNTASQPDPVIVGFRGSAGSIFLGGDTAFHFNSSGQLRRALADGSQIKAERGELVRLLRQPAQDRIQLLRRQMDENESAQFQETVRNLLRAIYADLCHDRVQVVGQVPDDDSVLEVVRKWLTGMQGALEIATRPHLK